jgi:uncharacterized membrane protein
MLFVSRLQCTSVLTYLLQFVEGLVTMFIGVAALFLLTDRPESAKWLSAEEKALAEARIKADSFGVTEVRHGCLAIYAVCLTRCRPSR